MEHSCSRNAVQRQRRPFGVLIWAALYGGCVLPSVSGTNASGSQSDTTSDLQSSNAPTTATATATIDSGAVERLPEAGVATSADASANTNNASNGSTSCACTTKDRCCDGCQPQPDATACDSDGLDCTSDMCRAGACVHEARMDACVLDGACHLDGAQHPNNKCLQCDAARNRSAWTAREEGASCDDGVYCDGVERCGGGAQQGRCVSSGDPCTKNNDACIACDEATHACGVSDSLVWHDTTTNLLWKKYAEGGGTRPWQAAQNACESLSFCTRSDWRLPTVGELRSLIRRCPATQASGACGVTDACSQYTCRNDACRGCQVGMYAPDTIVDFQSAYWTSTPADGSSLDGKWVVGFRTAAVEGFTPSSMHEARCVTSAR